MYRILITILGKFPNYVPSSLCANCVLYTLGFHPGRRMTNKKGKQFSFCGKAYFSHDISIEVLQLK